MPVAAENAEKSASKLLIGQRVAERVDGTVGVLAEQVDGTVDVAQPIGDVVDDVGNSTERGRHVRTEADQQGQHVPRSPADHERAEDYSDGPQRLSCTILLLTASGVRYWRSLLRTSLNTHEYDPA